VAFNIHQLVIFAARSGNVPLLLERLAAGGNLNHVDPHFGSALAAAAMRGHLSMVEWLLQHGADPNLEHGDCVGPLEIALRHPEAEIVECLLKAGARLRRKSRPDYAKRLERCLIELAEKRQRESG
jgi:hypothetical protein